MPVSPLSISIEKEMNVHSHVPSIDAIIEEAESRGKLQKMEQGTFTDHFFYIVENKIATNPIFSFEIILYVFFGCIFFYGFFWFLLSSSDEEVFGHDSYSDSFFLVTSVLTSSDYDDSIPDRSEIRVLFFVVMITGLVVFATLIGFINEHVMSYMGALKDGSSKVLEDKHTLILGWNESTANVVVQICFLRRVDTMINEERFPILLYLPFLLGPLRWMKWAERPSTSMSANNIVIMCKDKTKEEMHIALRNAMNQSGIKRRTKIGSNIICRVGDPLDINELLRVGVHRASAILVQMSHEDHAIEMITQGKIKNGATSRVALSARNAIFSHLPLVEDLRVVLQMSHPSEYIDAAIWKGGHGNEILIPMDLSRFLNSLLFKSAITPGLSQVLYEIFNFEGLAIRRRRAKDLKGGPLNEYGHCCGMGSANGKAQTFREMQLQYDTAVFIGLARPLVNDPEEMKSQGLGLCCDPETLIQKEDLLIYIGRKPTPRKAKDTLTCMAKYEQVAQEIIHTIKPITFNELELRNILICGWRDVWEGNPERFKNRVRQFTGKCAPGSCTTFVNNVELSRFQDLMAKIGVYTTNSSDPTPIKHSNESRLYEFSNDLVKGVFIRHVLGDAADPNALGPIVLQSDIHSTIVLGTQSSEVLPIEVQDVKVLNIMLLLRKLCSQKQGNHPRMHVVGENQQDITARLALVPTYPDETAKPDFINTQAIYARVLSVTMAYPTARYALADLFNESEGSANLELVPAINYIPLNKSIPFGVVRKLCLLKSGERTICIGYQFQRLITLMPHHKDLRIYGNHDFLVVIRRTLDAR